jgi:hypothetical protein
VALKGFSLNDDVEHIEVVAGMTKCGQDCQSSLVLFMPAKSSLTWVHSAASAADIPFKSLLFLAMAVAIPSARSLAAASFLLLRRTLVPVL